MSLGGATFSIIGAVHVPDDSTASSYSCSTRWCPPSLVWPIISVWYVNRSMPPYARTVAARASASSMAPASEHALMAALTMVTSGFNPVACMRSITASASRCIPASAHASIADVKTTWFGAIPSSAMRSKYMSACR